MTATKAAFLERLEVRLEEMNSDLRQFEARVRNLDAPDRPPYIEHLVELVERRDRLQKEIAAVRSAGSASWMQHRKNAESALSALVAGMADAKERLESQLLDS